MSTPRLERRNLAAAFKPATPDRAAGLGGILPRPAPPAPSSPSDEVARTADRPAPQRISGTTRTRGASIDIVINVPVYLEPDLLALVREAKRRGIGSGEREHTYDELLVNALDTIDMSQLAAKFAAIDAGPGRGPLQPRIRRQRGTAGIQVQLRLNRTQRDSLDALVTEVGAPSRSALAAAAYRLHLS